VKTKCAWLVLIGVVLALSLPGPVRGQEAERRYVKRTLYDFDDDLVTGSLNGAYVDGEFKLGTTRMQRANRLAAEILEHRMRKRRPDDLKRIRRAAAADVIVVQGTFDRVEDVLRAVKVKHVVIPARLVDRVPLMSLQTVMVNCPGELSAKAIAKLRRFVKTGGYLVTTDWALAALEKITPGFVSRGGRNTRNDVVRVHVHDGADPVLSHVLASQDHPRWWLEAGSYPIRILDRKRVKVLISSKEMAERYGHSPVAVTFRYDDGRVLHMTSHFYLQQAKMKAAREKARGSAFAASAGVDGKTLGRLKRRGLDKVEAGALNSAYSMQQVTANMLVAKAKDNLRLLERFPQRARRSFVLRRSPGPKAAALAGGAVDKDYLLRIVAREGGRVKVRDLFGREGWTEEANLVRRKP
jgi:hypothetical protein